jgi:magnesium transporter
VPSVSNESESLLGVVEHGLLSPGYTEAASVDAALESANGGSGGAWIGVSEPTAGEMHRLAAALGVREHNLSQLVEPGADAARARASVVDGVTHLIVPGTTLSSSGIPVVHGELEVLATPAAVVVASRGLDRTRHPSALREQVVRGIQDASPTSGGAVARELVAIALAWYADVVDKLEEEMTDIAEELFGESRRGLLSRIYALARPVHGTAVAVQPFKDRLAQILRGFGNGADNEQISRTTAEAQNLGTRIERLDGLLVSTLHTYFALAQDEANSIADRRNEITQRISAWALLLAIPTVIFSIYGTNFEHIPLIGESWGYFVAIGVTAVLCLAVFFWLRRTGRL